VAGRVYSASKAAMVRDPVYLSLLGNDPAPAYLGLKMVEQRIRGVARAIFYPLRVWNEVYKAKHRAFSLSWRKKEYLLRSGLFPRRPQKKRMRKRPG